MKIDKKVLNRHVWYENKNHNIVDFGNRIPDKEETKGMTYHTMYPLEVTEHIYKITEEEKFEHLMDFNHHIGSGNEDVILAMANSGDYTLGEAIMLWANCCERCMNVLAYKYLDGKDGYEEYSEEWKRCNTECNFCRGDDNGR